MDKDSDKDVDHARRGLLRKLGLGAGLAYVAPALTGLSVARASGGSDDDDDAGGGGNSSGDSSGSGRSDPSRPARVPQPRQSSPRNPVQTRVQPPRPSPRPEIVALIPAGQALDPALASGFRVVAQQAGPALGGVLVRFELPQGQTVPEAVSLLGTLLPGTLADENHVYRPDDFLCDGADCAAHVMVGWSGWPSALRPRLGMIDTGINTDHPALQGRNLIVHQVDLGDRDAASRQHGTAIAALLVGNVDGRVPGLLPDATLIAVEAFHRQGSAEQADAFSVVTALDLLLRDGVQVVNMSFSGPANAVLARMIALAAAQGVALVAAAGNGGPGADPAYPAAWPEVIAVTAVDSAGRAYRQANQGPYVALAAPGVNLWTAASISGGRLRSGTSYAAPFVTAALAVERLRAPMLDVASTTTRLLACARDLGEAGFDPVFGHGLLSAPGQCAAEDQVFSVSGE